jgi:hypothetical protein
MGGRGRVQVQFAEVKWLERAGGRMLCRFK